MKYFQEVTEWNADYVPNHVYYLTDDKKKLVGYIPAGSKKLVKFSRPLNFDSKGRKFIVLSKKGESDEVYFPKSVSTEEKNSSDEVKEIVGSSGKKYTLVKKKSGWTCSCPGFQFRNKCKHVG